MSRFARMHVTTLVLLPLFVTACSDKMPSPFTVKDRTPHKDVEAPFDPPERYPEWAYDQRSYMKPAQELTPEPKAKPGDPLHYFTKEKIVLIRQPSGYTPEETPRIGIWWTDNNGFHWHKAGYFGRQQSFFPFEVSEDGDYGIRFVGPGQQQEMHALALPERVYHVDTVLPQVEVTITPEQTWYNAGDKVTISWHAEDYHLIELPVCVTALMDFTADDQKPIEIQKGLAAEGNITWDIPAEAVNHEVRIRVDAIDRASNLGIAYSHALQIVTEKVEPAGEPDAKPVMEESVSRAPRQVDDGQFTRAPKSPLHDAVQSAARQPQWNTEPQPHPEIVEEDPATAQAQPNDGFAAPADPDVPRTDLAQTRDSQRLPYATAAARQPDDTSEPDFSRITPIEDIPPGEPPPTMEFRPDPGAVDSEIPAAAEEPQAPAADPVSPLDGSSSADWPRQNLPLSRLAADRDHLVNDLTNGNGFLIPLPATVEGDPSSRALAANHPWRVLGRFVTASVQTVWALPRARLGLPLDHLMEGRFLADNPLLRIVGEPGPAERTFVGLPVDRQNEDPPIVP